MVLHNLSLSLFVIAAILRVQESVSSKASTCGLEIDNADVGVLQPTAENLSRNVCTWTIVAPSGRKLSVTVESLWLNGNATLEVVADGGNTTVYSGHCAKCPPSVIGRMVVITYKDDSLNRATVVQLSNTTATHDIDVPSSTPSSHLPTKPYFLLNYVSFDPHRCAPPAVPRNGVVETESVEIGGQIFYRCRTPYLLEKESSSTATCVLGSFHSPVPSWSSPPPQCLLPECGKSPIRFTLDNEHNTVELHSGNVLLSKVKICTWEVATDPKSHLVISVDHLSLPKWNMRGRLQSGAVLELYDGKVSERRLMTSFTGKLVASGATGRRNFTTIYNKLIVLLRVGSYGHFVVASNDPADEKEGKNGDYGFHVSIASEVALCEIPAPPTFGDVKGWLSPVDGAASAKPNWTLAFSCNAGYHLNGSGLVTCLDIGKWNNDFPVCLPMPPTAEVAVMPGQGNFSTVEESLVHEKSPLSKQFHNRRPHLQSTEEKTSFKPSGDELDFSKQQLLPLSPSFVASWNESTGDFPEEDSEDGRIAVASGDIRPYPPEEDEFDDPLASYPDENESYSDNDGITYGSDNGDQDFPVIPVILGVGIPLILGLVTLGGCLVYRRLYPVRMGIGRKFDTFENPVYEQNKRGPTTPGGTLLPGVSLAQSPAELQRLTMHTP